MLNKGSTLKVFKLFYSLYKIQRVTFAIPFKSNGLLYFSDSAGAVGR